MGRIVNGFSFAGSRNPIVGLFASGEEGAWYDPSDLSTMFTTSTGTTAAAVDGPVGLLLDKRKGLARGADVWSDPPSTVDSDWTDNGDGSYTYDGTDTSPTLFESTGFATGSFVEVIVDLSGYVSGNFQIFAFGGGTVVLSVTGNGTKRAILSVGNGNVGFDGNNLNSGGTLSNISIRPLPGNHATQATAAARPTLRQSGALYYLEFDGDDDGLASNAGVFTGALAGLSLAWAGRARTITAARYPIAVSDGGYSSMNRWAILGPRGTSDLNRFAVQNSAGLNNLQTGEADTNKKVLQLLHNGSTRVIGRINGAETTQTADTGTLTVDQKIDIGAVSTLFMDADSYAILAIDRELTEAERALVDAVFAAKAGVTL